MVFDLVTTLISDPYYSSDERFDSTQKAITALRKEVFSKALQITVPKLDSAWSPPYGCLNKPCQDLAPLCLPCLLSLLLLLIALSFSFKSFNLSIFSK